MHQYLVYEVLAAIPDAIMGQVGGDRSRLIFLSRNYRQGTQIYLLGKEYRGAETKCDNCSIIRITVGILHPFERNRNIEISTGNNYDT